MAFDTKTLQQEMTPSHYGDVLLPVGVVGVLMLMMLPLPPFLLDLFLSFSLTVSMLILLVTMNSGRPADFSVFPSVLLLGDVVSVGLKYRVNSSHST